MNTPSMQDMLEAGVHFGHKVSRGNPRMKPYVYAARDGIHIIDLAKSEEKLKEAIKVVNELGKNGGTLLVVGTKKQAREVVEVLSKEAGAYYLNVRWIGGLLTNFDEVRRNIKKLNDLKNEKQAGTLSRYTKKEQLLIARKLEKFDKELGGVAEMDKLPDAIFILDCVADHTAVKEAIKSGVTLIGVSDTNANPDLLDYPIPANDDGIKSIKLVAEAVINAYRDGKKDTAVKAAKQEAKRVADEAKAAGQEEVTITPDVLAQAAEIEEEIEKAVVQESERKVE